MQRSNLAEIQDDTTEVASTVHPTFRTVEALYPIDFSPRLITLLQRLQRRGQEPLFPTSWQLDFPNLPSLLFMHTSSDQSYAPIRAVSTKSSSEFRGKLAMERLLQLGREVRETETGPAGPTGKVRPSRGAEGRIVEGIRRFIFWAAQDAMVTTDSLQSFVTVSALGGGRRGRKGYDEDVSARLTAKTTSKLTRLAASHREAAHRMERCSRTLWKSAPDHDTKMAEYERALSTTLYGFAVSGARCVIVGLTVSSASNPIRTLLVMDLNDAAQDLWSVLAIVLTVCAAREERLDTAGAAAAAGVVRADRQLDNQFSCMKMDVDVDVDQDL
ncbi:protein of unknown function [Taphrina deformans PYCC 5710]|uniref:Uncharacterized protein n=1 Tax=Taphrina deformans (strain PYCC 5710 / ATCC 11124 / CBS 356.35 / IMI 108563 / JCM 9778 / NBRC 8474) TaxID=1097556 RepID=R4ZYN3_TAPDE|nr:protein of unknown function [Taphrina deformans PYCC 5710]|eukprot:CCX35436.1 protein of unknown function [Taphrina deformans PYCC 5710]